MAKTAKKSTGILLAGVLFGLFWPLLSIAAGVPDTAPARLSSTTAIRLPYSMDTAFFRADPAATGRLPGGAGESAAVFLAVTATPEEPGVSLYASGSQARGKVTEISVAADGRQIASPVVFPKGTEKPDPLVPGAATRMFDGAFTALVPLPEAALAGKTLDVRLTGLACSAVNCTPLVLTRTVGMPDAPARGSLPDAAAAPWWEALVSGVAEPMGTMPMGAIPGAASSGSAGLGTIPLTLGSEGAAVPLAPRFVGKGAIAPRDNSAGKRNWTAQPPQRGEGQDGPNQEEQARLSLAPRFVIDRIRPTPFTPELEVRSLGKAVLFGFLAGIILNLMPCVLPVLGIKLASLLGHGGETPEGLRRFRRHQAFFALGILLWFAVMAALFHFLHLAWGQIFQSPVVVFALALMLLFLALSLFGVFSLPLIDLRMGNGKNQAVRAVAEGFGATLLATPCGGPLLGGVLSWALMQPFGVLALTLACVGLGMASPYLLLAAFPALAKRLPRPGEWMRTMEHVLGFLLLGTVAYLVHFLPSAILPRVVASLVLAAFGCWLWQKRLPAKVVGIACIALACVWPFMERPAPGGWVEYSHAAFEDTVGKRPILVDFTADWCPTCKMVEATALREDSLRAWEKRYNLALFRVDMTHDNPEGEALLRAVGSVSIPVIAVFPSGDDALSPLILRDIVTAGQVEAALQRLSLP